MILNDLNIVNKEVANKILNTAVLLSSIIVTIFVLFYPPTPGVADQGDFQRVMTVTGLKQISNTEDINANWFKYVTTEYEITPISLLRFIGIIPTTSMIYPISISRILSRLLNMKYFDTRILAFVYSLIYIFSFYICVKCLNFNFIATKLFFIVLSIFILFDGNYLVWFNSIYGEAMMISSLLLFIASILYFANKINASSSKIILYAFIAIFLFLGAKMQCFPALPILALFFYRIYALKHKSKFTFYKNKKIILPLLILLFYVGGIYIQVNGTCGIDTQFNSVFFGILKNSDNPGKDLKTLGLPSDMIQETGKHAYLPKNQYIKYTPSSEITKNVFNKKISNVKLLFFYLTQPERFIKGMQYTASRCFDTGGSLGKYEKSSVPEYTYKLKRFTLWSNFRVTNIPKKLVFIVAFYFIIILLSIIEYIKRRNDTSDKIRIELLWVIMLIGILQFPMPFIGNGEADTSKQLFLFNYTFDISIIIAFTYIFDKIYYILLRNKKIFLRK